MNFLPRICLLVEDGLTDDVGPFSLGPFLANCGASILI